jgi:ASCH domain
MSNKRLGKRERAARKSPRKFRGPVITLYQPWATWIMRGWKTIETRTHKRFYKLTGQRILIHAGKKTDSEAILNTYLTREQILEKPSEMINGFILGSAFVDCVGELSAEHSKEALIDCGSIERFGLLLNSVNKFEKPIPCKGEIGIWYYDLENKCKVKKH